MPQSGRSQPKTNLRPGPRSRKAPKPGDLFALELPDRWLFGRVVATDAISGMGGPVNLIYVYRVQLDEKKEPDRADLRPDRLLLPPMMTNRLPWSRGYFQTLTNIPLDEEDVLPRHCFRSGVHGTYHDEYGRELPGPIEPVGEFGLHSYASIDDEISQVLGIPSAEDD